MGGGGKQTPTVEEKVDNTNIGLLNLSENGLTNFGIGEILTVLLLMLVIAIIGAYCCKIRKQARMLEMQQSLRNAGVYRSAPMQEELYPHRQGFQTLPTNLPSAPIPMVTFSSLPGSGRLASRNCFGGTGGFNSFQWSCKDDGRVKGEMNDKNNNFYLGTFGELII